MSKTYKHNSYHKPKQRGRIFEKKKDKWVPKKQQPKNIDPAEVDVLPTPESEFSDDPSYL